MIQTEENKEAINKERLLDIKKLTKIEDIAYLKRCRQWITVKIKQLQKQFAQ